ncbi:mechanosensitive ion channel family protein [Emcibacter sp. SYSU 3D8]|uniref:mechanosensitive ion channel family protein n=1 Tax=Emcibacter sp. SYSU 3D8 TaxID=3133969 RepID=UPI0031FF0672
MKRQGMDRVNDFWTLTVEVWTHGLLGTTVGDILIAIGIVLVAVVVRRLFSHIVVVNLKKATARTRNQFDDAAVDAIAPPLRLVPVILGLYLAFRYLEPAPEYWVTLELIIRSMVAFAIFWAIYRAIAPMSQAFMPMQAVLGAATIDWMVKAVRVVIAFIGIAIVLEMWGIKVGPLLAGLGLFGVAIALGAQDLFKNLIAGIAILTERRFAKGEAVRVDGVVEGSVEAIGFRSTFIRTWDRIPVYVPNTQMADNAVSNLSRRSYHRVNWLVGLEYRTTGAQLRQIREEIEAYILSSGLFSTPPENGVVVRIDAFNASSIDMLVQCFSTTPELDVFRAAKEQLLLAIKDIVENAGSGFAFPSQSLYVEKGALAGDEDGGGDDGGGGGKNDAPVALTAVPPAGGGASG